MQTFDQSRFFLYKTNLISFEEALRQATNPDEFKLKVAGIQSTADMAHAEMEGMLRSPGDGSSAADSPFEFSRS
jgi:twitching motility protein PilT